MLKQLAKLNKIWRISAVLSLIAVNLVISTPVARAATTVSIANGDVGALTAAIVAANSGSPQVINLAAGGDYVLTTAIYAPLSVNYSGLPEIVGDVTIHGNGATIERSSAVGTPSFGVLDVGTGGSLNIDDVTITGGYNDTQYQTGGGIYNEGTLTVTNCTITGNTAPGAGGGIYNFEPGSVMVIGSTISNNTSAGTDVNSTGGGIENDGDGAMFTVANSTITGNYARYGGGGIGIANGTTTIFNSTVVGNSTSFFGGGITLTDHGVVTATNSIVADNSSDLGSLNANVDGAVENGAYGTFTNGGHNLVETADAPIDPLLGPLASNGGPTQTMALLPGSPAIDAGDDTVCASSPVSGVDQRGYTRPHGLHCDIGAFELDAAQNQAPSLATDQATVSVTEGQNASDTGTVSDLELNTVSLSASIGSVVNNGDGTWSWGFVTTDGPGQSQTITISGDDGHGGTSQTSFDLVVSNVAPTATFNTPSSAVYSGDTFTLSLTNPYDPSTTDMAVGLTYAFDCGSGYGSLSYSNSASCTAGDTSSQSVKAQIRDNDGGLTEYTSSVSILTDTIAPVTSAGAVTADAAPYTFGTWTKQAVTVTLSASDSGGSGVANIFYTVNDGNQQTYSAPFTFSSEGAFTIVYWSSDNANNDETPHHSVLVNIDQDGPTISGTPTTSPNGDGWYNGPVTIHWTCTDTGSGVTSCPVDQTITVEGSNQSVSGTATDLAGNSITVDSSAVNIDLTAPTNIAGAPDRASDSNGWYNHAVVVTFTGQDGVSGIAACTASSSYNGPDSATASVSGTCTDNAGNTSVPTTFTLQYDATAPANIAASFDRGPDSNGWYNHAVTITFSGDDTTSGAGSCTSTTHSGPDDASVSLSGSCTDVAGNQSASVDTVLKYDDTAPTNVVATPDRAPNGAGWYNAAVTFTVTGEDATSGIATCDPETYSGPDSAATTVSGGCTDVAGNTTTVSPTISYDATAPVVTYTGNPGNYTIGQTVSISCATSDNLSGVAATDCQDINAPAYTFTAGGHTISTTATDLAGNVGHGSVTFTVTASSNDLTTLTNQFASNRTLARRLSAPLAGVALAERLHNAQMKAAFVNSYILLVNQQRGLGLTNQEADTLIRLAREM